MSSQEPSWNISGIHLFPGSSTVPQRVLSVCFISAYSVHVLAGLRAQGCSYPFAHAPLTTRTPDCRLQTSSPTFRPLLSILCSIYYHRTSTDVALACPPHWNRNYTKTEISIFIFIFFFLRFLSLVYYFMSSI